MGEMKTAVVVAFSPPAAEAASALRSQHGTQQASEDAINGTATRSVSSFANDGHLGP